MPAFANRMSNVRKSFIREILKVTENPEVISFAGGLPNPKFFPVEEIAAATQKVLRDDGRTVLQYSTTEGYAPLREYIAARYAQKFGVTLDPAEILITNGSQQGLDLIGKIFINPGDPVLLERPGYLGAIQNFSLYEPQFHTVPLLNNGPDIEQLKEILNRQAVKLFYTAPNFQNPSGVTYSQQKRETVARLSQKHNFILVEDDPYGDLRFAGEHLPSMRNTTRDNLVMLGSFSKIVSPGLRLGWICAPQPIMEKIIVAKQASDLHSNHLSQRVVYQFLQDTNLAEHLAKINAAYGAQRNMMVDMLEECLPPEVTFTRPEGGMFVWVSLPEGVSAIELFDVAAKLNVAFVPGLPFYVDGGGNNTLRLNFSNSSEAKIETGITRLAEALQQVMRSGSRE